MKSLVRVIAASAAVFSLAAAYGADDDFASDSDGEAYEEEETSSADSEAEEGEEAGGQSEGEEAAQPAKKEPANVFYLIPFCRDLEGRADVLAPGDGEWKPVVEGRYYPLGSSFRTVDATTRLVIKFGPEAEVSIKGIASFATSVRKLGDKTRAISLVSGTIRLKLPSNLPEGWFTVHAPGFAVTSAIGESRYTYRTTGDGDEALVRCVTQTMTVEGPHFKAPDMKAANEMLIRTSSDQLHTVIYGTRGDIHLQLDQGLFQDKDYTSGEKNIKDKKLDWKLSPRTTVRIHRARPKVGKNLAVTIMTFDSKGELRNRCAFAENMFEVNSGEIGPTTRKEREEIAKKAAQIAEQQASDIDVVDETEADGDDGEADSSGGDSGGLDDDFDF